MTTSLPANVTIVELPVGTTLGGTELLEAVQTAAGTGNSVAITVAQVSQYVSSSILSIAGLSVLGVVGTSTATAAAITGTTDQVLRIAQNGTTLGFGAINLATSAAVTGVLRVVNGGTNTATFTPFGVVFANGSTILMATAAATAGYALLSNNATAAPSFQQVNLTASVTGVLGVPFGGTNTSTLTAFGVLFGNGTSTVGITAAGASGVLVATSTTVAPSFALVNLASTSFITGSLSFSNLTSLAGLSVLGNSGTAVATTAAITGVANQVLGINAAGITAAFTGIVGLAGALTAAVASAIPSGGSTTIGMKISSAANFGVFVGTGAPTLAAATSSVYFRSNPANATSRVYVNTDGGTTWVGITATA